MNSSEGAAPAPILVLMGDTNVDQVFPVLISVIKSTFIIDNVPPKYSYIHTNKYTSTNEIGYGQLVIDLRYSIHTKGHVTVAVTYNVDRDKTMPNQFTRISIEGIQAASSEAIDYILSGLMTITKELNARILEIKDITKVKPSNKGSLDLLMTIYTNQSVYSHLGFVQVEYPQLISDLRILLYTPLAELALPNALLSEITATFDVSKTDNLNTLFFILYPNYVNKLVNKDELNMCKKLYKFLVDTLDKVRLYTLNTMYIAYNMPTPANDNILIDNNNEEQFLTNMLKFLQKGQPAQVVLHPGSSQATNSTQKKKGKSNNTTIKK